MELSDLLQQAQAALNAEDYPRAVAACEHVLASYPACLSAHRVLGQALLEQGVVDDAIAQFASTLNLDPLDIVARLSFGVATVERNDPRMALAHYQRAWDLDPRLDQVRDELIRILSGLDADAQLHPSRAGLASIHARNGELDRAASEWRAVLAAEPADDRAPVALAEVLWRKGDDAEAIAACRDALKRAPRNARALAILAEIEHRRNALAAHETISRYHALDPGNDIVAALASDENANGLSFLIQPAAIADFHYTPVTVAVGRSVDSAGIESANPPHGGGRPAPDLWAPGDDDQSAQAVVPFDWDAAEADTPAFPVAPGTAPFADLFDGAEEESEPAAPSVGAAAAASDAGAASDTEAAAPALDGWDEIGRALSGSGSRYGSAAEAEVSEATAEAADLPQPTAEPLVAAEPEASAPSPATELELDPEPVGIEALAATEPATDTAADLWDARIPLESASDQSSDAPAWPVDAESEPDDALADDLAFGSLFARLRAAKADLVASGALAIDRELAGAAAEPSSTAASATAPPPPTSAAPEATPDQRFDLAEARDRLRQGPAAATAVVRQIEALMARGHSNPRMARVLGEAYLQLGETSRAAALFRQAATRRGTRRDREVG
ncbi:MAG: tetratricopeptide repeat protein [Chloroflexota bacterium]|nr:tetratricopeptide repeat protein [Chloroflexota bacterium]